MKSSITLKASLIAALSACLCLIAGCNRSNTGAGSAASDTSAAAPAASAPAAVSFPATAASDAPAGASQ
jgi:hypothetical protein